MNDDSFRGSTNCRFSIRLIVVFLSKVTHSVDKGMRIQFKSFMGVWYSTWTQAKSKCVLCGENLCVNSLLDERDWAPSNRLVDGKQPPSRHQNREYRGFQVLCTEEWPTATRSWRTDAGPDYFRVWMAMIREQRIKCNCNDRKCSLFHL
jgi:hypothetical protein